MDRFGRKWMPTKKTTLKQHLKKSVKRKRRKVPLWDGPSVNSENGGVTQSLLKGNIVCKERSRQRLVYGYAPKQAFQMRMEYGNMWHLCEELHSAKKPWRTPLKNYAKELATKFKAQQQDISLYYNLCNLQFPLYVDYWKSHEDMKSRKPILSEENFCIPYTIPDGRIVFLKGKFDSADSVTQERKRVVYLQENKAKGSIDEDSLQRQLTFDVQTMIYIIALKEHLLNKNIKYPVVGVRYNVIRRPLAGGKYSIRKKKPTKANPKGESDSEYYGRLEQIIKEDPKHFFIRWNVEISEQDIKDFKEQFLDPQLTQLVDWWDWIMAGKPNDPWSPREINGVKTYNTLHHRAPYGIYSPMNDGKFHYLDNLLNYQSIVGLERREEMFPEL